jgi:leader peptidase (prepilin peptidase)/N-methyltransferase
MAGASMPLAVSAAFAGALGAVFGSFFNVVAYRLPRGESLVSPGSRCPGCGVDIKRHDNVPILGWLWLRGRCRSCAMAISARYPSVEALTAVLAVVVVLVKQSPAAAVLGLALVAFLVPIALIDLDHRIIPNRLTLPAAVVAVALGLALKPSGVPGQLLGGVGAGGFLLVFVLAYPRGMGMGDVKLAGVLGLYLGAPVAVALLVALLSGSVLGAAIMARLGVSAGRRVAVPFGPFLALGGVVAVLAGGPIMHWYLHAGI